MAWYHCGRCGLLFRAPADDVHDRRCSKCGRHPALGVDALPAPTPAPPPSSDPRALKPEGSDTRRPRRNFLMAKILLGWMLATGLIVLGVRFIWHQDAGRATANAAVSPVKGTTGDEAVVRLNQALPACFAVFGGFLSAGTPEERNQFVLDPVATAGRMARFYDLNPWTRIDPSTLRNTANSLLVLPTGSALESRWLATDGRMLDCVFVLQNGEWRLDWEHFARYGEYPWSLFLTGGGEPELEFRLLVRERLAKERSEASHMSLMFYAPRFGYPEQAGTPSPEFLVKRDSPDGRLLAAAFHKHEKREPLYGSKLASPEPPDMIRVRVRIRRLPADAQAAFTFELTKVVACHWLALDDAGVSPAPAPAAAP